MKGIFTLYVLFPLLMLTLTACVKDKPQVDEKPSEVKVSDSAKVFIVNEGNFGSSNASISLFNRLNGKVNGDIFYDINGLKLGDIAQSLYFYDDHFYIVVNNSGKILICDKNFKLQTSITGLASPRYMAFLNNIAYVSDFKSGEIHVLDLLTKSKIGKIPCAGWTEDLIMLNGKLFVSNPAREYLYVIDTQNNKLQDSVWLGINVTGIQADKNEKLWILSAGKNGQYPPKLFRLDPQSLSLEFQLSFAEHDFPFKLCRNSRGDTLYYINKSIYAYAIQNNQLPGSALVEAGTRNFYGLGVHPVTSEVYLSDALDFVQSSHLYVYAPDGALRGEFKAGINASGFYFE